MTLANQPLLETPVSKTANGLGPVEVTGVPDGSGGPFDKNAQGGANYEILGQLGEGAMGQVRLARDPVLRRTVALKSLLPRASRDSSLLQRFVGEMQITAQLDHPHIVPIYGIERGEGPMSYAMKLVQGKELEHLLEETRALHEAGQPLDAEHSLQARLEIFTKVCDAVAYAHSRSVIHRDLKPSNIMIGQFNEVYVMDWGVARQVGEAGSAQDRAAESVEEDKSGQQSTRTRVGATIGTPLYMSPEQAAAKNSELDGRSDQYALGLILQEIVTLELGMAGATVEMALVSALQGKRNPMQSEKLAVPRELKAIVDRACRMSPADRYASVADVAADVRRYMNNEAVSALPDTLPQRLGRWVSNHRMLAIGLLTATFFLGVAGAGGVWAYNQVELAEKRNREVRLVEVQADSATRAQQLDATLVGYEQSLQRLAGAAGILVEGGAASPMELLTEDRFGPGEQALEGLVQSAFYGKRISLDWLVAGRAPDSDSQQAAAGLGALQALGPALPGAMIDSLGEDTRLLSPTAQQEALAKTGAPIIRVGFALESGLSAAYPGMAGLSPTGDGRADSLYQQAKLEGGVVWGPPTQAGDTMLLTCATTIETRDGLPIGVARFEIDAARAIALALTADKELIETSLLVDRTGKVLAQSAKDPSNKEPEILTSDEVRAAIARGETGYIATKRNGRDVLITYQPLASMDWYLVTIANVAKLEDVSVGPGPQPGSVPGTKASTKPLPRPPMPGTTQPVTPTTARPVPPPTASASASASASTSAWRPGPGFKPGSKPPPNPFEPWPVYKPK